jgi:mRNA interferase HicA
MKSNELKRLVEKNGWKLKRQSGSHAVYTHDTILGDIVLPLHGSKEVSTGVEKKIKKQAGL